MARDKLITIRIEGEKRQAFGDLAKSQNTDTASLLYDFINQCLSGTIDISLVTGKKQWIDKLDNQLDSERIDKLETATQKIGERLDNWIWVSERSLENNLNELRDQVNALAIQLNRQQIDRIDTDSQQDSQQIDDMEPLLKREREASIATSPLPTSPPSPALEAIEDSEKKITLPDTLIGSPIGIDKSSGGEGEPVKDAIETVGMTAMAAAKYLKAKKVVVSYASLHRWVGREKIPNTSPQGKDVRKHLILRDKLYFPKTDQP